MKCPKCKERTEVLETSQTRLGTRRRRRCLSPRCEFRFTTNEALPGADDTPADEERMPAWLSNLNPKKVDVEAIAAAVRVDRRRREIRRQQRERDREERNTYWDDDRDLLPDHLDEDGLRRELKGY